MSILVLYLLTTSVFLIVDMVGLHFIISPVFHARVSPILLDQPRYAPAAVFYLFYVAALVWLVVIPGDANGSLWMLALNAAIFGAAAYGTYEFTNLATLRGWCWTQVIVDVIWGTSLTMVSAVAGLRLTHLFGFA